MKDESEHKLFQEGLSAYMDGELAGSKREGLEGHLSGCSECRERLEGLKQTSSLLKRHMPREAPLGLATRALARSREPSSTWVKPAYGFAFAAAGVLLLLGGAKLLRLTTGNVSSMISGAAGSLGSAETEGLPTGPTLETRAVPEPGKSESLSGAGATGAAGAAKSLVAEDEFAGEAMEMSDRPAAAQTPAPESLAQAAKAPGMESAPIKAAQTSRADFALAQRRKLPTETQKALGFSPLEPKREDQVGAPAAAPFAQMLMPLPLREGRGLPKAPDERAAVRPESRPRAQDLELLGRGRPLDEAQEGLESELKEGGAANTVAPADRLEWSGTALHAPVKEERVVIKDMQAWMNFWALHSAEPVPLIDFQKHMVVGIVAGPGQGWARVRRVEARGGKLLIHIRRRPAGDKAPANTFHLKAVPRSDLRTEFVESK